MLRNDGTIFREGFATSTQFFVQLNSLGQQIGPGLIGRGVTQLLARYHSAAAGVRLPLDVGIGSPQILDIRLVLR